MWVDAEQRGGPAVAVSDLEARAATAEAALRDAEVAAARLREETTAAQTGRNELAARVQALEAECQRLRESEAAAQRQAREAVWGKAGATWFPSGSVPKPASAEGAAAAKEKPQEPGPELAALQQEVARLRRDNGQLRQMLAGCGIYPG